MLRNKRYIFSVWLQGEQNSPPLVKACFASMRKYAGECDVVILDSDSIKTWIDIPYIIQSKYECGMITKQHYTDYARFALLNRYGGVWLDATCLITAELPVTLWDKEFFVFEYAPFEVRNITLVNRYTIFFMASKTGNDVTKSVMLYMEAYFSKMSTMIAYLQTDLFLRKSLKELGLWGDDSICEYKGDSILELQWCLGKPYDDRKWHKICNNSYLHKLTHRISFPMSADSRETFISNILNFYSIECNFLPSHIRNVPLRKIKNFSKSVLQYFHPTKVRLFGLKYAFLNSFAKLFSQNPKSKTYLKYHIAAYRFAEEYIDDVLNK